MLSLYTRHARALFYADYHIYKMIVNNDIVKAPTRDFPKCYNDHETTAGLKKLASKNSETCDETAP